MATTHITAEKDAVISEIFIAAPPERVFRALTNREQALQWGSSPEFVMTKWEMDARLGGKWVFIAKEQNPAGKYANTDLVHHGEILEFEPPRLLEYTWFASWHTDPLHKTIVRWELSPVPAAHKLRSRTAAWHRCPRIAKAMLRAGRGWSRESNSLLKATSNDVTEPTQWLHTTTQRSKKLFQLLRRCLSPIHSVMLNSTLPTSPKPRISTKSSSTGSSRTCPVPIT